MMLNGKRNHRKYGSKFLQKNGKMWHGPIAQLEGAHHRIHETEGSSHVAIWLKRDKILMIGLKSIGHLNASELDPILGFSWVFDF